MEIQFYKVFRNYSGYAPLTSKGVMSQEFHHCKEVFGRRLIRSKTAASDVVQFLRNEDRKATEKIAKHQEKVLHAFERAMGITPPAKVEIVKNNFERQEWDSVNWNEFHTVQVKDRYYLYTVSKEWAKNQPLTHILALVSRNYYPQGRRLDWRSILKWLHQEGGLGVAAKDIAREIVMANGELEFPRTPNNGIESYAEAVMLKKQRSKNYAR